MSKFNYIEVRAPSFFSELDEEGKPTHFKEPSPEEKEKLTTYWEAELMPNGKWVYGRELNKDGTVKEKK